jgi:hypothetical protein
LTLEDAVLAALDVARGSEISATSQ